MEDTKRISVIISFGENGTVYGCGHALDTMLYAYGLTTEEETWEWAADAEHDAIGYVLREYDWEAYTLERLNLLPTVSEEYLHGDYLRFEFPDRFKEYVREDRERISELVKESLGDWSSSEIPADLKKDLVRAYEGTQEYIQHEWLHGDRSNDGVLSQLAKALFGRYTSADIDWDPKTDTVTIDTTPDEWREWMGYDLADGEPLPDPKTLGENMRDVTLYKAQEVKKKKAAAQESRQQERARLEERRRLQEEEEREAARQRKIKKDQAS